MNTTTALPLIDTIYIDGQFVTPQGTELFDLHNPATEQVVARVRLGDREDARRAIAAAKRAFERFSRSSVAERIALLQRLHAAVAARENDIRAAMQLEYGAPDGFARFAAKHAADAFTNMVETLRRYEFTRRIGTAEVQMEPVGVVALITPWNSNAGFICNKLATAIAAGCTAVIKPSEMSAQQTQVVLEALHAADLPAGLFNIVNGRGDVVGDEFSAHPDVSKVSFTGSTAVGKAILRAGAETLKRVTLELGGKSPTLLLPDADFTSAIPLTVRAGFINSGQACIAGTRILVPEARMDEALAAIRTAVEAIRVGPASDPASEIGPMVSARQWERVQGYIALGAEEGAQLLTGGPGRPEHLSEGWFVRPTVFAGVRNDMRIAREEIFGPVLCVIGYRDEEDAIAIANDTNYGLQASVYGSDFAHARKVASRLQAGRVLINGLHHEPLAPFGGFKQSGIGREFGAFGLEAYLEPKTLLGAV
ncbi:aldehyde dehydrogenase family protein [Paucibacter sp. R3-3]|uniref:aldehyde dehydrogenase (NAD(+)) n=1 Tax=Roseateles agri TaxID=3098619 RepID=A0ABU5DL58_9BURK|nr:aldehyde dehydrogenase family protein [Paucibacter sp. R3-3]MDY0746009.1 aldehyde dehydrogenase family protein [Paucibacter sp. R3-3]